MNAIEPVWSIPKAEQAKSPHKNIHDVKQLIEESFDNMDDEYVRNCIDHVREQEDYYRHLHGKKSLNVEDIEMVDDYDDQPELVEEPTEDTTAFAFDEEGQIFAPIEENVEVIEMPVTPNSNADSYICEPCNFKTTSPVKWSHHLKSHHKCDDCGKEFHGANGLRDFKRHLNTHKLNQCDECGKEFFGVNGPRNLKNHLRTHKPKQPFSCGECEKSFQFLSFLNRHKIGVHGAQQSGEGLPSIGTVGGSTTEEKNPGQQLAECSTALITVGGPTTEEKNPGQPSLETSALPLSVNSGFEDQPRKRQRKQKLVARAE